MSNEQQNSPESMRGHMEFSVNSTAFERLGISTGWDKLDYFMRGFHPGKIYVVGGRPGDGKTSFATTLTANILGHAKKWGPVLYFSTELDENEIGAQIAEALAGGTALFPTGRSLKPHEKDRLWEATERIMEWMQTQNLFIRYEKSFTVPQIGADVAAFRDGVHGGKLAMVIIDQASRIKRQPTPGIKINYTNATEDMLNNMEVMIKDVDCPLLLLTQANRDAKSSTRAFMHHLKHSGAFEEYAHCVMMLDVADENSVNPSAIHLDKNRHGPTVPVYARFHGEAHTWEVRDA